MTAAERKPLPTKEQIQTIAEEAALIELRDEIESQVIRIETDLEFQIGGDDDWAHRARAALGYHRQALRRIDRRVGDVRKARPKAVRPGRPKDCCDPLSLEVLAVRPEINVEALQTVEAVDERIAWLAARTNALTTDREDEIAMFSAERDEGFLASSGRTLRHMRWLRQTLQDRRGKLSKVQRRTPADEQNRERLFIDACREVLDRDTFLELWRRVDAMERAL